MIIVLIVPLVMGLALVAGSTDETRQRDHDAEFIMKYQSVPRCYRDTAWVLDKGLRYTRCFMAWESNKGNKNGR